MAPLAVLLALRLADGLGARDVPEMQVEEIMSEIAVDVAVAGLTLFAALKVGGWRGRFLWIVAAALMLTIALDKGFDVLAWGMRTGCWPWAACDEFKTRFTIPLYPVPPKGDRVNEQPPLRRGLA